MKFYYAFKVFILNCLSFFCRKIIGIENLPAGILDWFIQRYLFNLTELAKRIKDNEALQKIEFVRYEHEKEKEKIKTLSGGADDTSRRSLL